MERPVLVERTAKRWKAVQLAGWGALVFFAAVTVGGVVAESRGVMVAGLVLAAGGVGVILTGSVLAWWHHG